MSVNKADLHVVYGERQDRFGGVSGYTPAPCGDAVGGGFSESCGSIDGVQGGALSDEVAYVLSYGSGVLGAFKNASGVCVISA